MTLYNVLTDTSGCSSLVGTKAMEAKGGPTMMLDLGSHSNINVQASLVIHEFGHALGLEHEHQRSDFWNILEPLVNIEVMKADGRMKGTTEDFFKENWGRSTNDRSHCAEYDPMSIMHYW